MVSFITYDRLLALLLLSYTLFSQHTNCRPTKRVAKSIHTAEYANHDSSEEDTHNTPGLLTLLTNQHTNNDSDSGLHQQQIGLLEYENQTAVMKLEEHVEPEVHDEIELPPDVYEVPLESWTEEDHVNNELTEEERVENNLRNIIRNTLQQPEGQHHTRHRGRTAAAAVANRRNPEEPVLNLPVENLSQDILALLDARRNGNQGSSSAPGSLSVLRDKDRFNVTVDYQAPFRNVDAPKLLEIVLLMRSDCTLLPKRIVRWVSGNRGILFECQTGAWVVRYLKRRTRKPRPVSVRDCHEVHMSGELGTMYTPHTAVIVYTDKERKSFDVLCKHEEDHTNHQLIDNRISVEPEDQQIRERRQVAGAWTIVQRRENGNVKFYRAMKRYKRGFGKIDDGEYWMGLEALHEITHVRPYMLRVEITTSDNTTYFSEYESIRVGSAAKHYRLKLGNFIQPSAEEATNSAGDFMSLHNRGKFQARDSDSEEFPVNCAQLYGTAFWFRGCWASVNLNGPYYTNDSDNNNGVRWATANPDEIKRVWKTEMMIKPVL